MRSSIRRIALLPTAVIIVAAACSSDDDEGASATTPPASPTTEGVTAGDIVAPPWVPATRTEELAVELSESPSGPSTQHAVDAFGLLIGDFPGVTPSELPAGDGLSSSYTLALISSVREELSDEQRAIVDAYLAEGTTVARISPDGSIELVDDAPTSAPRPSGWRRAPESAQIQALSVLFAEVQEDWAAHLPDAPAWSNYELAIAPVDKGDMEATYDDEVTHCIVRVDPDYLASNPPADKTRWLFAHELFHCIQFRWAFGLNWSTHPWVFDGSAEWATADLYRNRAMTYNNLFEEWFTSELNKLGSRQYDAWPLFENAYLNGHDVYAAIKTMFQVPVPGVGATLYAGKLDGQVFRIDWSTRTLRWPDFGPSWRFDWPWQGNTSFGPEYNHELSGTRGLGPYNIVGAGGFAQPQFLVTMTDDVGIVTVTPNGAPLTTRTATGTVTVGEGLSRRFCFAPNECRCPGDLTSGAFVMDGPVMVVSFAAADKAPRAALLAEEWDPQTHCDEEPEPNNGSSDGDPHLVSFDGLPFDINTLGEFVLARDPDGGFEVQTRHQPVSWAAGTSAVALGADGHRVTFTMPTFGSTDAVAIRVDGEATGESDFVVGGVRIVVDPEAITRGGDVVAVWPDGTAVRLHWALGWFVQLTVPAARAARLEGLLGAADGDLRNDLRLADGTTVDSTDVAPAESPYSLAWRVDADSSLFDYEPGQSVETFHVAHPNPTAPNLDAAALDRCATALGPDAASHIVRSCAFDVSATSEETFIDAYVEVAGDRETDVAGVIPATIAVPATRADGTIAPAVAGVSGEPVLTLGGEEAGTIDTVAGTVLLARTENCGEGYVDLVVAKSDDSTALARAAVCDPSGSSGVGLDDDDEWINGEAYVWIPGDGAYDVAIEVTLGDAQAVGPVELYIDPSPTIVETAALAGGHRATLRGIGDTVAYFPDPASTFTTSGLETACATDVYWGDQPFPSAEPFALHGCQHRAEVRFPPTDTVVPVVVVNRTPGEVEVMLTPVG